MTRGQGEKLNRGGSRKLEPHRISGKGDHVKKRCDAARRHPLLGHLHRGRHLLRTISGSLRHSQLSMPSFQIPMSRDPCQGWEHQVWLLLRLCDCGEHRQSTTFIIGSYVAGITSPNRVSVYFYQANLPPPRYRYQGP